jgi:glyoxylase-like metal-dependent hydrolase (beta-lactamase superfamily II)
MTYDAAWSASDMIEVGETRVLALSDGVFTMPPTFLSSPEAHASLADQDGHVHLPVGAFLFPGDEPLLVDLGFGPGPANSLLTGGNLMDQLRRVGCDPEDVASIALTHPHPDHVGWLATREGRVCFPRATVLMAAQDWTYFVESRHGDMDDHIHAALLDLHASGRVELLEGEHAITAHVTALPAPGHTPGHTVFAVHDHGERAILLGDALYCPQQLGHSDWEAVSDVDPELAARTRIALERDLEKHDALAVGAHFPGLVAGRLLRR